MFNKLFLVREQNISMATANTLTRSRIIKTFVVFFLLTITAFFYQTLKYEGAGIKPLSITSRFIDAVPSKTSFENNLLLSAHRNISSQGSTLQQNGMKIRIPPDKLIVQPLKRRKQSGNRVWRQEACQLYWEEQFRNFTVYRNLITNDRPGYIHNISIITQLTPNRLSSLKRLYESWNEAITAVIYVEEDQIQETLRSIKSWLPHDHLVSIHLVLKKGILFPQNVLTNIAQENARARFILYLDVDFVTSTGLHSAIMNSIYNGTFKNGNKTVLVLPSFEVNTETAIPHHKKDAIGNYKKSVLKFNFGSGRHVPDFTMTEHWLGLSEPYKVKYGNMYEPFIVVRKNDSPPYFAYFQDRWRVKVSHIHNLAARCFEFWVLPDGFVVHVNHPRNITYASKRNIIVAIG